MIYTFFALLILFVWYIANKELGDSFNKYLKYSSLLLVCLIIFVDVFMFIETERLLKVNEGNNQTNGIQYAYVTKNCPENYTLVIGNNISGNLNYLCNDINTSAFGYTSGIVTGVNLDVRFNFTASNPTFLDLKYSCNDTDNDTKLQYFNGNSWVDLAAITYSNNSIITTKIAIPSGVSNNSFNKIRFYDAFPPFSAGALNVSYIYMTDEKITSIYNEYTSDTANIVGYHYSEYAFMPILSNTIMFIIIFAGLMLVIQYLYIVYIESIYGRKITKNENSTKDENKTLGDIIKKI